MRSIYLFLSIAFNVVSYLLFKSVSSKPVDILWIVIFTTGLVLGGVSVFFFTIALKEIRLSIAYPIFSGGSILLMAAFSLAIFAERIGTIHIVGAAVIVLGIALMSG